MSKLEVYQPLQTQPEFPEVDLTEENADMLSVMLQNEQVAQQYHRGAEGVLVFRQLHPALEHGVASVYDEGARVDAMSHGMMTFEAINAAVASTKPATVRGQALSVVIAKPKTVQRIGDPAETQEVNNYFIEKLPRTASVVSAASERFFPGHIHYALAGAALECLITSQALYIDRAQQ